MKKLAFLVSILGAGPGLFPHGQSQNRLPHASWFSKRGHSCCRHQETFLIRNSAFWGAFTRTGPDSSYA